MHIQRPLHNCLSLSLSCCMQYHLLCFGSSNTLEKLFLCLLHVLCSLQVCKLCLFENLGVKKNISVCSINNISSNKSKCMPTENALMRLFPYVSFCIYILQCTLFQYLVCVRLLRHGRNGSSSTEKCRVRFRLN